MYGCNRSVKNHTTSATVRSLQTAASMAAGNTLYVQVAYNTYLTVKAANPDSAMGGFTRILHCPQPAYSTLCIQHPLHTTPSAYSTLCIQHPLHTTPSAYNILCIQHPLRAGGIQHIPQGQGC